MGKPKLILLVFGSSLAVLLLNRFRPASATSRAVERLRRHPGQDYILSRKHLLELVKFHLYFEELTEVQRAVRDLVGTLSFDLEEQMNKLANLLRFDRRPPEEQSSQEAESELDRFLVRLPRGRRPSFFHVGPPDPREAMRGAASYKPGVTPEPGDERGAVYHEDGSRQEQWITKDPVTGQVKIVLENYDADGTYTEGYVQVKDRNGNLVRDLYARPDTGSGIEIYGYTEPPHGSRHFWRRSGETEWHRGRPPHSIGGDYPTDDQVGGGKTPHYFLKLPNGEYAMCYMVNPQSGLAYCTLMSRDQINVEPGMASIIDATDTIIDPDDWVTNPVLDYERPREGTPAPIPREEGPGARFPRP